jgi:hypothetical protein
MTALHYNALALYGIFTQIPTIVYAHFNTNKEMLHLKVTKEYCTNK